ncbi:DUF6138 family protein [Hymenobacter cellulosivorans]|uniref:DUF6138 family protein n=1 Tax=Hymenobacter cellulosivorans TaxID=2932249 RepID=A0ABY4FFA0_9BACT|nr:DUF6138 family protein [Hymenobacter cellulosivorans]UOQ55294.1 DUF6138 family protein [Hymenobacter cellulosivorans]
MSRKIDYLVQIEGNEATLDAYVAAVFEQRCTPAKIYPFPYQLPGYENCLSDTLIEYFMRQPFELDRVVAFFEKLMKVDREGYKGIRYSFDKWVEATIKTPYFENVGDRWHVELVRRPEMDAATVPPDYIKFMCYLAIGHLKYGPSFASVTANEYFGMATDLGSNEVERLKKFGSGELPKEVTEYKDELVSCTANDAFGTIRLTVKQESVESYLRIFQFLNRLLQTNFPRSYSIDFSSKHKSWLPIKGLPRKGVHALFANAAAYESLHPLLVEYANLAMSTHDEYTNLDDEAGAMPGSFAVFALGLQSEAYFELVKHYMRNVDEEHQSLQEKFTAAFVEKFGITEKSLPIFISCVLSTQWHRPYPVFRAQFQDAAALTMLLNFKKDFAKFLLDELHDEDAEEVADYAWDMVLHAIFGPEHKHQQVIRTAPADLQPLYEELFHKEDADE